LKSVKKGRQIEGMDIAELKVELEKLHSASFGWALSCCGRDRGEAEEVLQTVYLKIFEGKARFRGDASLKTWLFAVIRNTAISERRRGLLRRLRLTVDREPAGAQASLYEAPNESFERSETQSQFQKALKNLPPRQREALHLVFYEDLSLREAAEVMRVAIGSARQHYERGKKRLRETLGQTDNAHGISWRAKENPGTV
jgi:RNA polymerase sigma factor (sigma-70 family)